MSIEALDIAHPVHRLIGITATYLKDSFEPHRGSGIGILKLVRPPHETSDRRIVTLAISVRLA